MAKEVYTYDPEKVVVQIDGTYLTGFADDSKIVIEQNEDDIFYKAGVDGNISYTINYDKSAKAKIPLMSTSPMIPFIRELSINNREFNFTMVDMNENGKNVSCDKCRIVKKPTYERKKEAEGIEFEVFIPFYK